MKDTLKGLGMGLDLLLKASKGRENTDSKPVDCQQGEEWFNQALDEDETGNFLEAYYCYRRVAEMMRARGGSRSEEEAWLLSRALNNAAIILNDHGQEAAARRQLEEALRVCPNNQVARENLDALAGD